MLWFGVFRTTDKETYINDTDKQIKTYNKEEIPKQSNQEKELLEEVRSDLRVNESEIFEKQRNQYIQEHLQKIFPNIDADSLAAEQRKRIIKEKGFITKEEELNIEKFRKALKKEIEEE